MKVIEKNTPLQEQKKKSSKSTYIITSVLCLAAILIIIFAVVIQRTSSAACTNNIKHMTREQITLNINPTISWNTGYISSLNIDVAYYDLDGNSIGTVRRGTKLQYNTDENGQTQIIIDGQHYVLDGDSQIVNDVSMAIPVHTLYVQSTVNLRTVDNRLTDTLAEKGSSITVIGYDYFDETGDVHLYKVSYGETEGYIDPWYLTSDEALANTNYDYNSNYSTHESREDRYGGGSADNLDYFPREKASFSDNVMPDECRTLYLVSWLLSDVDSYIEIADNSGINAFVVDITDGGSIGYAADVMNEYCPSGAANANNTVEEYQAAIQKLKDAGYYVIGRITTFNDSYFVSDHPECAIMDTDGNPLRLSGEYWPSAYNRYAWQYKVDLAVEAVQLMGFNEIQFDYVRFPDSTWSYEDAGTIEFGNTYGETKAQAIQRFLMYATDILHEYGAYVSADVYGESAYNYVTAYGQYWPAISNVVDVISGMPYPDHFGYTETWLPWEHPYETLYSWGENVMIRQNETATPAKVRTWIQAYNAIRKPYNTYGVDEVAAQIKGLRDSGCTGGYMTWNASSSVSKYTSLIPAFAAPDN